MFGGVVKELVSVGKGIRLGNHVQQIKLRHTQACGQFDDFVDDAHVLFVDDHIDIDDWSIGIPYGANHSFDESFKTLGGLGQPIVQLGIVTMERKGDFSQTRPHRVEVKFAVGESVAIGHRLNAVVADFLGVPNEVEKLGV